ncbi:pectate lyase [Actinoplanes regularis]|uniref:pectate lyase n=1 Tax=Actinoplanes regularis TaxID=52697 RepID=UPI0024A1901A|nr:pectate lyase [Actinoplanes regularis]GLW34756.1 hypothetical protein Areg01_76930 [Actinoplanes regularis]
MAFYPSLVDQFTLAICKATIQSVIATSGRVIAGVNTNYGDVATLKGSSIGSIPTCWLYTGNNTGAEPTKTGTGVNGKNCIVS